MVSPRRGGGGNYDWAGKVLDEKENAAPASANLAWPNVKEDMCLRMIVLSTQSLRWTPGMVYDACRAEIDKKFPLGWTGLQKLHAVEIVRNSRNTMGLGNSIATVVNTPTYSNMTDSTDCSFLQFSGSWSHPVKADKMHLMAFGNPN
jgi:hypothetical protein